MVQMTVPRQRWRYGRRPARLLQPASSRRRQPTARRRRCRRRSWFRGQRQRCERRPPRRTAISLDPDAGDAQGQPPTKLRAHAARASWATWSRVLAPFFDSLDVARATMLVREASSPALATGLFHHELERLARADSASLVREWADLAHALVDAGLMRGATAARVRSSLIERSLPTALGAMRGTVVERVLAQRLLNP